MSDIVESAREAREKLAGALAVLQAPEAESLLEGVASSISRAIGTLYAIESGRGPGVAEWAPRARDAVRAALAALQSGPADDPLAEEAMAQVAACLGIVHGLAAGPEAKTEQQPARADQPKAQPAAEKAAAQQPPAQQPPAQQPPAQQGAVAIQESPAARDIALDRTAHPVSAGAATEPAPDVAGPGQASPAPAGSGAKQPSDQAGETAGPGAGISNKRGEFDRTQLASPPAGGLAGAPQGGAPDPAEVLDSTQVSRTGRSMQPKQSDPAPAKAQPGAAEAPAPEPATAQPRANAPSAPAQPQAEPTGQGPTQQSHRVPAQADKTAPKGSRRDSKHAPAPSAGPKAGAVEIEASLGAHSPTNFYKGLSGNDVVDDGGLFIATYQIPDIGTPLWITVHLPGGYDFSASGVVKWTRPSGAGESHPGFGAAFDAISSEARQLIYRYVRNREPLFHDDL